MSTYLVQDLLYTDFVKNLLYTALEDADGAYMSAINTDCVTDVEYYCNRLEYLKKCVLCLVFISPDLSSKCENEIDITVKKISELRINIVYSILYRFFPALKAVLEPTRYFIIEINYCNINYISTNVV
jgi:hypothetical protein